MDRLRGVDGLVDLAALHDTLDWPEHVLLQVEEQLSSEGAIVIETGRVRLRSRDAPAARSAPICPPGVAVDSGLQGPA